MNASLALAERVSPFKGHRAANVTAGAAVATPKIRAYPIIKDRRRRRQTFILRSEIRARERVCLCSELGRSESSRCHSKTN